MKEKENKSGRGSGGGSGAAVAGHLSVTIVCPRDENRHTNPPPIRTYGGWVVCHVKHRGNHVDRHGTAPSGAAGAGVGV